MTRDSAMSIVSARRGSSMVAAFILAATMLSGCAGSTATHDAAPTELDSDTGFTGISGVTEEYAATAGELVLPEGDAFPEAPFGDSTGSYQAGYGASAAVNYWNCAWGRTFLAAQGVDPVAADAALVQFAAIMDTEVYKLHYDPASAYPLFEEAVANGQLGDPSGVQLLVDGGCPPK